MKVLIVGGTRYLGLAIVRELLDRKHEVTLFHRGITTAHLPKEVKRIHGDVRDRISFEAHLSEHNYDAVIDTILQTGDLEWMLPIMQNTCGQLIHCGSTGVYAPAVRIPSREDDPTPCLPEFGYFGPKLAQDRMLMDYFDTTGYRLTSLRISNVIGPGDIPLDIWGARNPMFFQRLADDRPIMVPDDGRALVQPAHVEDLARGFRQVLDADNRVAGHIYHLSSDRAVPLMEYARMAAEILGSKSQFQCAPMDAILATGKLDEPGLRFICEHMCIDITKARRDFAYTPEIDIDQALRESLDWMVRAGHLKIA